MFLNKQHGSIIWGLKIQGLDPATAAKHESWVPLGVVQGPTEPRTMEFILASLLQFFLEHDPGMGQVHVLCPPMWHLPAAGSCARMQHAACSRMPSRIAGSLQPGPNW